MSGSSPVALKTGAFARKCVNFYASNKLIANFSGAHCRMVPDSNTSAAKHQRNLDNGFEKIGAIANCNLATQMPISPAIFSRSDLAPAKGNKATQTLTNPKPPNVPNALLSLYLAPPPPCHHCATALPDWHPGCQIWKIRHPGKSSGTRNLGLASWHPGEIWPISGIHLASWDFTQKSFRKRVIIEFFNSKLEFFPGLRPEF